MSHKATKEDPNTRPQPVERPGEMGLFYICGVRAASSSLRWQCARINYCKWRALGAVWFISIIMFKHSAGRGVLGRVGAREIMRISLGGTVMCKCVCVGAYACGGHVISRH
jgi:hypothetical protein